MGELEGRIQKLGDLHQMELRQVSEKNQEERDKIDQEQKKLLDQTIAEIKQKHLEELGEVRDRSKNMEKMERTHSSSTIGTSKDDEVLELQNLLNRQLRVNSDLQQQLETRDGGGSVVNEQLQQENNDLKSIIQD